MGKSWQMKHMDYQPLQKVHKVDHRMVKKSNLSACLYMEVWHVYTSITRVNNNTGTFSHVDKP